jgi:hypothetical protein
MRPLIAPIVYAVEETQDEMIILGRSAASETNERSNIAQFILLYWDISASDTRKLQVLTLDRNPNARDWIGPLSMIGKSQKPSTVSSIGRPTSITAAHWDSRSAVVIITDEDNSYSVSKMYYASGALSKVVDRMMTKVTDHTMASR